MRYKFRYLNGIYKTLAAIAGPMLNFSITIAVFIVGYYLFAKIIAWFGVDDSITNINWNPYIVIKYSDIASVNINYSDLHFTKYRFSFVTLCGDESYNVELTLKNGKKYFFSIYNQEEFCENLNSLMTAS